LSSAYILFSRKGTKAEDSSNPHVTMITNASITAIVYCSIFAVCYSIGDRIVKKDCRRKE